MNAPAENEDLRARVQTAGTLQLPYPPEAVFPLLTPEGERAWIEGWAPRYPAFGRPSEAPGTVFLTDNHGDEAVWVVVEKDDLRKRAAYACVIPGVRGTLVRVACRSDGQGGTAASIEYSTTALSPESDAGVEAFRDGFDAMLAGWRTAMLGALGTED